MKNTLFFLLLLQAAVAAAQKYPQNYFRNPVAIPLELVANFGELRANHWHMGLDIRTQRRENLPVYAAADGYIATVSVDAYGFGRAIYINHPNGLTTLYAHLNHFEPRLNEWLKEQQYKARSWAGKWEVPKDLFPVKKGGFIAYSGNTGGSQGPHVHFEIRETATGKCLNPLLFNFPIPDAVPPVLQRLALYNRNQSVLAQLPKMIGIKGSNGRYTLTVPVLKLATDKVSFAIGAIDRFTGYTNPNGIFSARLVFDDSEKACFELDGISYDSTRYLNAHIDYKLKSNGGPYLQHLSQLPGERSGVYKTDGSGGIIHLTDTLLHDLLIEIWDAAGNKTALQTKVQYVPNFFKSPYPRVQQLLPNEVNVFEQDSFELYTSEMALYDSVTATYAKSFAKKAGSISAQHYFAGGDIPTHDSVTVRLKLPRILQDWEKDRVVIWSQARKKEVVQKATVYDGWAKAKFRQFGFYQAVIDTVPPTIAPIGAGDTINLAGRKELVFVVKDNLKEIHSFTAEVNGEWLLCTNDKGLSFRYQFDKYFPSGISELVVRAADEAGNITEKRWWVRR